MTLRVKLFWDWTSDEDDLINEVSISRMEHEMNEFLSNVEEINVKKIYVALGCGQRMGLIEYRGVEIDGF